MAVEQTNGYKEAPVISDENFESFLMEYMNDGKSNVTPGYHYELETDTIVFDAKVKTREMVNQSDSGSGNSDSSNGTSGGNVNGNTEVDFKDSGLISLLQIVNPVGYAKISVKGRENTRDKAKAKEVTDKSKEDRAE